MFEIRTLLILIPALPLLATIVTACLGPRLLRGQSHQPTIWALAASFLCSVALAVAVGSWSGEPATVGSEAVESLWTWADVGEAYQVSMPPGIVPFQIDVSLRADGLTAVMLTMVTLVALLVAIYSVGYMHGDRGYWRFFTYVSLFAFSMTMLVLVSNFLLLYVFWEAVGVCSYLLIGFWYEKPAAAAAGKKAFLVNRIGDFGFALAIFLIWVHYGTLNYHDTLQAGGTLPGVLGTLRLTGQAPFVGGAVATAICLLLMLGACGKSAQFPLHVWLPDAMEGPTPVSALIHAATMVTAGVYMVARCAPLFAASPDAQLVVACIGGFTALLAALIALTQFDLKRILAYSTISQLGYMFLALGTGTVAGVTAGMFHLFTHAFFKALLFLGAGSVMHAMGNVIDIRRFGGLRHRMPWTHRTFLVGCLALAGIFPFAGFWSKDQVLASVHARAYPHATHDTAAHAALDADHTTRMVSVDEVPAGDSGDSTGRTAVFAALYWSALFTAFLTAFYTFRAYFLTFFGPLKIPEEAGHHAHESPPVMWLPLVVLAIFAFGIGFVVESGHRFASFLGRAPSLAYLGEVYPEIHLNIALISTLFAGLGVGLAAFFYLGHQREIDVIARRIRPLYQLSYHKFFLDEIYQGLVVWPLRGLAWCSYACDRWLVDGLVDLCGRVPLWIGRFLRQWQVGYVPFYSLMMVVGTVLILILGRILWGGG